MSGLQKITTFSKSPLKVFLFCIVFAFTFVLRAHSYERTPGPGHLDEMLYAWSGLSLIQTGEPISWSTLDYPKTAGVFKGVISYKGGQPSAGVTLYKPWLDEPPLFSYLVGFFADRFGARQYEFIPSSYIRYPIVLISSITSIFVFLIASGVSGFYVGLLAMLVYGTVPVFVFASRTAMPETLISFCFTVMVYLIIKFYKKMSFWYVVFLPLLAGISGLSKPTGFFIIFYALFFLFKKLYQSKQTKRAILYSVYLVVLTLPFVAFYFWWGYHWDWNIFLTINKIQSFRPVGFGSLAWYFITPSFDTQITRDSWFVFGLLSAAYYLFKGVHREKFMILMAFIFWVAVVMISGGENDLLSWYRFPSYPFLAIILSWGLAYLIKKANIFAMFVSAGMLLGNRMLLVNPFHQNVLPSNYRIIMLILFVPPLAYLVFKKELYKRLTRYFLIAVVVVGIFFNVKYIYNAFEIACQSKSCAIVPSTNLSELRLPYIWRFLVVNMP